MAIFAKPLIALRAVANLATPFTIPFVTTFTETNETTNVAKRFVTRVAVSNIATLFTKPSNTITTITNKAAPFTKFLLTIVTVADIAASFALPFFAFIAVARNETYMVTFFVNYSVANITSNTIGVFLDQTIVFASFFHADIFAATSSAMQT